MAQQLSSQSKYSLICFSDSTPPRVQQAAKCVPYGSTLQLFIQPLSRQTYANWSPIRCPYVRGKSKCT